MAWHVAQPRSYTNQAVIIEQFQITVGKINSKLVSGRATHNRKILIGTVDTPNGPEQSIVAGARNARSFDTYSRVDIRASRDRELRRGKLTYYFELQNLFDTKNTCCVDDIDIAAGPTLLIAEEDWGGMVPSLGLIWTFH